MEQTNLKWGTPTPIIFKDMSHTKKSITGMEMPLYINLRAFGEFSFKIENETIFQYDETYIRSFVVEQFVHYITESSNNKVTLNELLNIDNSNIAQYMNKEAIKYGFHFTDFTVKIELLDESKRMIEQYENN